MFGKDKQVGDLQLNKGPVELNKQQGIFNKSVFNVSKKEDDTSALKGFFTEEQIKGLQMQKALLDKENAEKYQQEQNKRKQQNQQKKQEPDPRVVRSEHLNKLISNAPGVKPIRERRLKHLPGQNVLLNDFGTTFKESIGASKRAGKIKNKKSRLFAKNANYNAIMEASNNMTQRRFSVMSRAMKGRNIGCNQQTFHDLSAFMMLAGVGDTEANKKLLDDYIGTGRDEETGKVTGQNRTEALDRIVQMMFCIDVSNVNFESDTAMIKSASQLENLVNCVGAFDRIKSNNNEYFEGLDPNMQKAINKRVDELRAVANYYVARKELLTDENFRTHYDYELSMEINENSTEEQRATAEKIMNSYVMAKNLIRINNNKPYDVFDYALHFRNPKSDEMFNKAVTASNTEHQRKYLEKAYVSMDYLAGGLRLNANDLNLEGGTNEILEIYKHPNADDNLMRSDIPEIKKRLRAKGIEYGLGADILIKNPYTGFTTDGLGIDRIINGLSARATASWGTDDIVDMIYGLAAPSLQVNMNLDRGTEEERQKNLPRIQKLNENFRRSMALFKGMQYTFAQSFMNTFGNLPQQLTTDDNKKLVKKYGDIIKEYTLMDQNTGQAFMGDLDNKYYNYSKDAYDRKLLYTNSFDSLSNTCLTFLNNEQDQLLLQEPGEEEYTDEHAVLTNVTAGVEGNPELMIAQFNRNAYTTGPAMSERQMKAYMARKKKVMSPAKYNAYAERRKVFTDTTTQVLKLWEKNKLTAFFNRIGQGTAAENKLTRKEVIKHLHTLDYLKTLPSWNNPEKEKNQETRKKIILAKENENYLKNVKKALDLAIAYKSLLETKQKELQKNNDQTDVNTLPEVVAAKREMDLCRESLQYCDSVTVVEARENSLREVQRPADEDYSQQAYDNALRDFKNLKIKDVKFGSYEEMIHNYQRNMDMCMKAMRFQNLLGEALLLGHEYKDKFLMECRAKIRFFAAIRQTLVRVNKFYADNADTGNAEQYRNRLEDGIREGAQDYNITAMPTNDIKALYNRFYEQVKNDHDNREDHIEAVCHIMSNMNYEVIQGEDGEEVRWPEVPAAEMRRRKKDYQKNAAIADFLKHQNDDYIASTNEAEAAVRTYLRRNGIFLSSPLDRTVGVYLSQMKPAEAIAAIRKYTGSNEDKVKFYLDMKREIDSVPVEEFSLQDLAGAFKGSTLRKRFKVAMLGQNAQDIGTRIAALMDAQKDPQPLPEEFESREDMLAKTKFTQDFFNTYVGRITSLCQRGNSQFAGAIDLYDYERLDPFLVEKKLNQPVISQDITEMLYMNDIALRARTVVPQFNYKGEIDLNDYLNGIKPNLVLLSSDMKSAYREEYKAKFGQYPPVNMQQNNQ